MTSDFNDLTDAYEAMIQWPKRLAREMPFFHRWFQRIDAKSVLDVACGTGHHAAAFSAEGLRVEAADISPAMVKRAQEAFGTNPRLCWAVRSFEDPPENAPFDAVVCIGNSLALCRDFDAVRRSVLQMLSAARKGGLVILQVLNLRRFPDGPCVWQKHLRATLHGREVLINKGIHRCGNRGFVNIVVSPLDDPIQTRHESIPLLSLELNPLSNLLQQAGVGAVEVFGNYENQPFSPDDSGDLILVARK